MKVLLTGAAGFIGARLAHRFLEQGAQLTALGRSPLQRDGVDNLVVPALAPLAIAEVLADRRFDVVVHLAAAGVHPADRDADVITAVNALLPGAFVSLAHRHGVRAFVMLGSSAEYRASDTLLDEDAPLQTEKLYGASKAAGGLLALARGAAAPLPVAVLRAFNVYGAGEAAHRLLASLALRLTAGQPVALSPGTQLRDFIHVDDVCRAIMSVLAALLDRRMSPGAYNLATGTGHTVAEFARVVATVLDASHDLLRFGALPFRPDDLPMVVGDPTRLAQACGWRAEVPLAAGLAEAVKGLRHLGAYHHVLR